MSQSRAIARGARLRRSLVLVAIGLVAAILLERADRAAAMLAIVQGDQPEIVNRQALVRQDVVQQQGMPNLAKAHELTNQGEVAVAQPAPVDLLVTSATKPQGTPPTKAKWVAMAHQS